MNEKIYFDNPHTRISRMLAASHSPPRQGEFQLIPVPHPIAGKDSAGDKQSVAAINRWRVLLHVENDRDALWLVQALENSRGIGLAWLAKDSQEALLYLRGQDIYANRAKYPQPNLVIVNSARRDAAKVLQVTYDLPDPPAIVQLTARPDVSESLKAMGAGADCCQPKPRSLGETLAFVDWLEGWLPSIAGSLDADNILAFPGNFARRDVPQRLVSARQTA
ncbi:MAG TPA: hypothetical protein VFA77_04690 [Candidatus Eisenbacteria bacterium]|nr:hypothetical protein [Candidatus Eisenbacteria bacterium]